ncbi:MAG TPA: aminoacyl-tRNA hydrolase [Victivallales bacterium]|nr:aminoacyl-tRNA hydrolase [Victivallales bacterium]
MSEKGIFFDLIVALGNPGDEYSGTRHNVGFIVADELAKSCEGISSEFKVSGALVRKFLCDGSEVHILKPVKFMNLSGEPVAAFIAKKGIAPERMIVIHDDMDIATGKMKFSFGSGAAGHNGVQSIIDNVGSANFARLRVGIGRRLNSEGADYVLSRFSKNEEKIFENLVELCVSAIKFSLVNGVQAAMNKYNRRAEESPSDAEEISKDRNIDKKE